MDQPRSTDRRQTLAVIFLAVVLLYLPLAALAMGLEAKHRPAGTILLGALNATIASLGLLLGLTTGGARMLRHGTAWQRVWAGTYALLLLLCIYDSLAHALQAPFMPTLDALLPNGVAGEVRGGIYWIGLVVAMVMCFGVWRQLRLQRRVAAVPPSAP
ncbi:MAG TPA: hypothetical protein VF116_06990 [Ktedonobacterales bacterium]